MSAFSIIQADGSTVNFTYSPQRNLQPTGAGTVAVPQYTCQVITASGATTAIDNDTRVAVIDTAAAGETITLPDPRGTAASLGNGFVIYIVSTNSAGNNVTVQVSGGGNPVNLPGGASVPNSGGAAPLQNGRSFMVVDNSAQGGWAEITI